MLVRYAGSIFFNCEIIKGNKSTKNPTWTCVCVCVCFFSLSFSLYILHMYTRGTLRDKISLVLTPVLLFYPIILPFRQWLETPRSSVRLQFVTCLCCCCCCRLLELAKIIMTNYEEGNTDIHQELCVSPLSSSIFLRGTVMLCIISTSMTRTLRMSRSNGGFY